MLSVKSGGEPLFLRRPGPSDRVLLDRLLTPDLFSGPIQLDGLPIEAPLASIYADLRPKLAEGSIFMIDPQAYRFQRESFLDQPSLKSLPYSLTQGTFNPIDFESDTAVSRFVAQILEEQRKLCASTYVAPAFFMESLDSPWREINERLLKETHKQAGADVFATLRGSYVGLCASVEPDVVVGFI